MKKLLILSLLFLTLFACNKEDIKKEKVFNIELRGAFMVNYVPIPDGNFETVHTDTLNYSLEVLINGESKSYEINTVLNSGFVGAVFEKELIVKKSDVVVLKIKDNNYPTFSHIYLRSNFDKLDFEEFGEFHIQ